jgi:hypothetical protein
MFSAEQRDSLGPYPMVIDLRGQRGLVAPVVALLEPTPDDLLAQAPAKLAAVDICGDEKLIPSSKEWSMIA